jgi:hypothetical protein
MQSCPTSAAAQGNKGPEGFSHLVISKIPGAPTLQRPVLITGDSEPFVNTSMIHQKSEGRASAPLTSQGYGLAAPASWDWDGDGLKDLLVGEFGSGSEFGRFMGNFIRVYPNTGTETQPRFSGEFDYARPSFEYFLTNSNGTPYSVLQGCCLGFTPQFADLNGDGYSDMITGQYYGDVTFFKGTANGFLPGEVLKQEGDPHGKVTMASQNYWLYSSATFGDFNGDGKPDLIVGGSSLRISKNVGTQSHPQFALRELLLDVHGKPLKVYELSRDESDAFAPLMPPLAGDYKLSPLAVDWDGDGVLDLLVTNSYSHVGLAAVDFFRGVKVGTEHRFETRVPLFTAKNGEKPFPGISPYVFVADWNHDGVNDLLLGTSVVTMHGKFNDLFSWNWEKEMGLAGTVTKYPGYANDFGSEETVQWFRQSATLPPGVTIGDYMTLYHQGYVYLMLGSKDESRKKQSTQRNQ